MEIQLHFVILVLDRGEWSGPHHGRYDRENIPRYLPIRRPSRTRRMPVYTVKCVQVTGPVWTGVENLALTGIFFIQEDLIETNK
jgi:hypothetical protein